MSYSIQRTVSDGTLDHLDISIEYFDRAEISVLFDGVVDAREWAWVGDTNASISFTPAVANGIEVSVVRSTDLSEIRHKYSLGALFTTEALDESFSQILHIAQEAKEGSGLGEVYRDLNFHGFKAVNVGDGSAPMDAVNHRQMEVHDATIVGYMDQTEVYKNQAAASAAAALASEQGAAANVAGAISVHVAELDPHTQYLKESDIDLANLAKVNVAQNFTVPQRSSLLTDNDGSYDLSAKQNFNTTTTAGAVTLTFTNQADGLSGSVIFINTSNHAVSAHANTKISTTALARLNTTGTYRIDYISDGTYAYCTVSENLA